MEFCQETQCKKTRNSGTGKITKEDYNILKTRFTTSVSPEERLKFHNVMHLYPTKLKVNNFNKAKLEAIKNTDSGSRIPVARIPAKHNSKLASEGTENEAGLLPTLHLAIQASVMLRANLWTEQGLVNGSMGKVIDIVYDPDATPGYDAPAVLICQFDSYKGPYLNDELKTVPIIPILSSWDKFSQNCTRLQFPVTLSYSATIFKSQGLTLSQVKFANLCY